jgi:hypothetical protein
MTIWEIIAIVAILIVIPVWWCAMLWILCKEIDEL